MEYCYLLSIESHHVFSFEQINCKDYTSKIWTIDINHIEDLDNPSQDDVLFHDVLYAEHGFPPKEVWQEFLSRVSKLLPTQI